LFVRSGGIGHVTVAKGYHVMNEWPHGIGRPPDGPPPTDWEWDQWLGPAQKVPYNRNRAFYNFRWSYNYSGGQLTNFGVHYMDMLRWCLGKDAPKSVTAIGRGFPGLRWTARENAATARPARDSRSERFTNNAAANKWLHYQYRAPYKLG
jgi:hypothetical protein